VLICAPLYDFLYKKNNLPTALLIHNAVKFLQLCNHQSQYCYAPQEKYAFFILCYYNGCRTATQNNKSGEPLWVDEVCSCHLPAECPLRKCGMFHYPIPRPSVLFLLHFVIRCAGENPAIMRLTRYSGEHSWSRHILDNARGVFSRRDSLCAALLCSHPQCWYSIPRSCALTYY